VCISSTFVTLIFGSCQTNHALDQFLQLLVAEVTKNIVRMGGGSKLSALDDFNIKSLLGKKKKLIRSPAEKIEEGNLHIILKQAQQEGRDLCETLAHGHSKMKWSQISSLVGRDFPVHHKQLLSETDEEGFQTVGANDGSFFEYWKQCIDIQNRETFERFYGNASNSGSLGHRTDRELDQLLSSADIWDLSRSERTKVIRHWESLAREEWISQVNTLYQRHRETAHNLDQLNSKYRERLLKQADVIGVTTAGLAKNASLLESVNPKTLICEEAGEVLEVSPRRKYKVS
jgi:hypothetical protein